MTSDFKYFLEWLASHPFIGFLLVIIVCMTIASSMGSLAYVFGKRRDDDDG